MVKKEKKNYTYELDAETAAKLNTIVSVMKERGKTSDTGKTYSKNIAVSEAIDYYYNSVVNHDPSFFTRICLSVTDSYVNKYFGCLASATNQMLFNDIRQNCFNEAMAKKLGIDIAEIEDYVQQTIDDLFSEDEML